MVIGVVLAAVGTACGPPKAPTEVVMKELSTDIVYGSQHKPAAPAPVPAANPTPGFPSFIVAPPPSVIRPVTSSPAPVVTQPTPSPTVPPAACPDDDPFTFPAEPAPRGVTTPPSAGAYTFRQGGTTRVGDAPPMALPASAVRQVRNVAAAPNGDITYDVVIDSFGDTTTTSYAVRHTTGDPSLDGVSITHIVTRRADGTVDEFAPLSGARIIALPAGPGVMWNDVATDPIRSTSMVLQGQVTDRGRVNACGTVLDSWTVHVTGHLLGPAKDLTLDATYQIGTQFGGFVLADNVSMKGTDGGDAVEQTSNATINDVRPAPLPPDAGEDRR
jgi:hypothetical protein